MRGPRVTLNEVKGTIPNMVPFAALRVTLLLCVLLCTAVSAQQTSPGPRDVVQSAERAVQDDSVATVRARWTEALRRDSTDRAAALGLGSLARLSYDFATAERLLSGILARAGGSVDPLDGPGDDRPLPRRQRERQHHPRRFPAHCRHPRGAPDRRPRSGDATR